MARRLLDLFASLIDLILLLPLSALIAVAIKLDSPGPVLFRGQRVGRDGFQFAIYKFRTMVTDADQQGPGITVSGDPRITRVGRLLRRSKLDELPQLINVLKGEMSLVGPRPEDPRYVMLYTPEQRRVLSVRPGLTSPASLIFRHEEELLGGEDWESTYLQKVLPAKLRIELEYLERRSVWRDLTVVAQTVLALAR